MTWSARATTLALCLPLLAACTAPAPEGDGAQEPNAAAAEGAAVAAPEPAEEEVVDLPDAAEQIAGAVAAAPPELRDGARVLGYTAEGELVLLRRGSNVLTCLADAPGDERFQVACYHNGLEAYMARGRALRREGIDGPDNLARRHEEIDAGLIPMPEEPASIYNLGGPLEVWNAETGEVTGGSRVFALYTPYATEESTGLSTTPLSPGAPWIMRPGTPSSHIMVVPPQVPEDDKGDSGGGNA